MGHKEGKLSPHDLELEGAIITVVNTPRLEGIPNWAKHDITLKIRREYCGTEFFENAEDALVRTKELLDKYDHLRLSMKSSRSFLLLLTDYV